MLSFYSKHALQCDHIDYWQGWNFGNTVIPGQINILGYNLLEAFLQLAGLPAGSAV